MVKVNNNYLKDKKLLLLSDTWFPYDYIKEFLKELTAGKVYIYSSPASTAKFIKVYIKVFAKRKVQILKDKDFKLFFDKKVDDYVVVIFFGKKRTKETPVLELLAKKLLTSYQDVVTVLPDGIDYDENSPLFRE